MQADFGLRTTHSSREISTISVDRANDNLLTRVCCDFDVDRGW